MSEKKEAGRLHFISIWFTVLLLMGEAVGMLYALLAIAQNSLTCIPVNLIPATTSLLFGGLGGCTYCMRGVYINACAKNEWEVRWMPWYILRPFESLLIGGLSYLFVKSGLLLLGATQNEAGSQLSVWAIAFLSGLNADGFIRKIESVGKSVWGLEPSRQSRDSSNEPAAKENQSNDAPAPESAPAVDSSKEGASPGSN